MHEKNVWAQNEVKCNYLVPDKNWSTNSFIFDLKLFYNLAKCTVCSSCRYSGGDRRRHVYVNIVNNVFNYLLQMHNGGNDLLVPEFGESTAP